MNESPPFTSPPIVADVNGGHKRSKNRQPPLTVPDDNTCFRLLFHASRIDAAIIKQFQHDTSAKIRIEVPILHFDDRVIIVIGNTSVNTTMSFSNNANSNESNNSNNSISNNESNECVEVSAAQEALIRVFERFLVVAAEADGGSLASGGVDL